MKFATILPHRLGFFGASLFALVLFESTRCVSSQPSGCETLEDCPGDQYCSSNSGKCLDYGACEIPKDCFDEGNSYVVANCLGLTTCEIGQCGIDCTKERCLTSDDCPNEMYCRRSKDGGNQCVPFGECFDASDCDNPDNEFALALCVGTKTCDNNGFCGIDCGGGGNENDDRVCAKDVRVCDDGSAVSRDPQNNCEFPACPEDIVCAMDVQVCDDGSSVSRDPQNNCEFPACPSDIACTYDIQECDDGSFVSRDPANNCEFPACPSDIACTYDIQVCDDGSTVSRDPQNNCEFPACPSDIACTYGIQECDDGSFVSRDPANNCEFPACPNPNDECQTSDDCPDDWYCSLGRNNPLESQVCNANGFCNDASDCENPDNEMMMIACVGTIFCENGACGKTCGSGDSDLEQKEGDAVKETTNGGEESEGVEAATEESTAADDSSAAIVGGASVISLVAVLVVAMVA